MGLFDLLGLRRRRDDDRADLPNHVADYYGDYADDVTADIHQWRPLGPGRAVELRGAPADMGPESLQISNAAWQATFGRGDAQGSMITIATYVAQVDPDDPGEGFQLYARFICTVEDDRDWSYTGYVPDPGGVIFVWLNDAVADAQTWAEDLADGRVESMENLPAVFCWDGNPGSIPLEVDADR